jgi:hypothetical protein
MSTDAQAYCIAIKTTKRRGERSREYPGFFHTPNCFFKPHGNGFD